MMEDKANEPSLHQISFPDAYRQEEMPIPTKTTTTTDATKEEEDVVHSVRNVNLDSPPYCALPEQLRIAVILTASFASIISPFSTSVYYPTVTVLAKDLGVPIILINLTISTYQIFQGIAPSFIAALSAKYGRRPAYMLCFIIYFTASFGLALQNNYSTLLVLRCVQSAGSSGTEALTAYATVGSTLGPALGPVIGGLLSQFLGWRSIFWFLLTLCSALALVMGAVFPETNRSIVGNGSVNPPKWNRSLYKVLSNRSISENRSTLTKTR